MRSFLVATALAALTVPTLAADLTPGAVRAMLTTQDATAVVQSLDSGDDENNAWFAVLDHIAAGERGWIDLVPLLAPGTDAGTAESLTITLSRALRTNAPAVLRLLAEDHYSVADICLDNDIEAAVSDVVAFLDDAVVAVAAVMDPALSQARDACLFELGDARISALI